MDTIANTGANLFCSAVKASGWASLEMQTCSGPDARFTVGLMTVAALIVFTTLAAWRLLDTR